MTHLTRTLVLLGLAVALLAPASATATPSTTFWTPAIGTCQARDVPHVTYDTYFGKGPAAGTQGAPNYPIDTGLTMGVLPFDRIQAEAGFDLLLPTDHPLLLNAKLCTPEASLFPGSPAISGGIYNLGFTSDVTDYDVLHVEVQKTIPAIGGYLSLGVYRGLNRTLMTNSDGHPQQSGIMAGFFSRDLPVGMKGLKKINLAADVQSGKNVLGAVGFGSYFYFTDTISLLAGPVFYLDSALQPGGRRTLFTVQLDVDITPGRP